MAHDTMDLKCVWLNARATLEAVGYSPEDALKEARKIAQDPGNYKFVKGIERYTLCGLQKNIGQELAEGLDNGWNIWSDIYDECTDVRTVELEKYIYFQ